MATMTTTTTTTSTTSTSPGLGISIDKSYIHTLFGKLNLLTLVYFLLNISGIYNLMFLKVANVICFICVASMSWLYTPPSGWFYFVCVTGFWTGLIEFFLGLCRIQDRMVRVVPWKLGVCHVLAFIYLAFMYLTFLSSNSV